MNIAYNSANGRFEAQFSADFAGDLAAVKAAKFRCDGPPSWQWWTVKLAPLNYLREHKPASGLTITEGAFAQYTQLTELEATNARVRAQFAPIKAEQTKAKINRRKLAIEERTYTKVEVPEKGYIGREDLPPLPPLDNPFVRPAPPPTTCFVCSEPTYFYELPDLCLWCENNA